MTESKSLIPKLHARAGAPTAGLISTMSTTTGSLAAVRTSTARLVSSSTKAVQATLTKVSSSPVASTKVTSSSLVRAVTSSTPPVKVTSTTAVPAVKTTSATLSTSKVVPTTSRTTSSSTIPTTTSTSSRVSTSTPISTTSSKSTQSSSSTLLSSSSSSSINIVAPASASASSAEGKETSSSGLSGGAIAGIIIGILVLAIAGALLAFRLIQKRRRANRRMTGNLQAWTDRTSYFSASGNGASAAGRGEREVEAGQVPFREMGDKDQDGGPWALGEKQVYEEPVLAGVGAGSAAYGQQYNEQAYQPEYQQQMQQHAYQPYADQPYAAQPYPQPLHTPTHQTQPQGYPYTPTAASATPNTFGGTFSPVDATSPVPLQEPVAGPVLQDGMSVVVRQGFVRTLEDELVIAPGDHLTVVQAYDDGWCLCQSALNEQGVVPQSCLEPVSAYAQGRTSPIQMPVPAVVVSEGNDEVLASEPEKKLPSLPRSETTKSLAVSERSERRSSLFLNAAAAGLYLQQNVTPTNQAFT